MSKKELCSLGAGNSGSSEDIPSKKELPVIDFNARFIKSYTAVIFYNTEAGVSLFHF